MKMSLFYEPRPKHKTDFQKQNIQRLKEMQAANREAATVEELESLYSIPSSDKYGHIQSRVFSRPESDENGSTSTSSSPKYSNFLRKGERDPRGTLSGLGEEPVKPFVREDARPRKPAIPSFSEGPLVESSVRTSVDFISLNKNVGPTKSPKKKPDVPLNKSFGKIPEYLVKRKAEKDEEERLRREYEKEMADCPPGHRLMPEEERLETLELLKKNLAESESALARLPFRIDTPSAIRRRAELDDMCKKLSEGIILFSKPKVFVKL